MIYNHLSKCVEENGNMISCHKNFVMCVLACIWKNFYCDWRKENENVENKLSTEILLFAITSSCSVISDSWWKFPWWNHLNYSLMFWGIIHSPSLRAKRDIETVYILSSILPVMRMGLLRAFNRISSYHSRPLIQLVL